jgi:hypothetical protein
MFSKGPFQRLVFATSAVFIVLWAGSLTAAYASNCNINTMPFWDNNITSGWLAQAQTFEAPSSTCNVLTQYEFELAGRSSPGQVTFNIFEWGSSGPVGSALYTTNLSWGTTATLFNLTSINLALTPGQLYGAEVDFQGYSGQSIYFQVNQNGYPGHDGWWYNPAFGGWNDVGGTNDYFLANFSGGGGSTPEPGSFILFGSGVLALAGVARRRIQF